MVITTIALLQSPAGGKVQPEDVRMLVDAGTVKRVPLHRQLESFDR